MVVAGAHGFASRAFGRPSISAILLSSHAGGIIHHHNSKARYGSRLDSPHELCTPIYQFQTWRPLWVTFLVFAAGLLMRGFQTFFHHALCIYIVWYSSRSHLHSWCTSWCVLFSSTASIHTQYAHYAQPAAALIMMYYTQRTYVQRVHAVCACEYFSLAFGRSVYVCVCVSTHLCASTIFDASLTWRIMDF